MEKLKKVISWPVILGIQVIATLIILFSIFKLNILPTTYAVMVGMILVLFCFINFALMKPDKKSHHHHHQKTKLIIINKANPIKNKTFLLVIRILFLLIKNKIIVKREI